LKPLTGRWPEHWPEYLIEAWGLGLFMVNACLAGAILEYPASSVHQAIPNELARRGLFGLAMGLTIVLLVYCPWGKRSGAHINPAITLTFLRLGKIAPIDALFYIVAQFAGGLAWVGLVALVLPRPMMYPKVNYVVTVPGPQGVLVACLAEVGISLLLMLTVLTVSNLPRLKDWLGVFMGVLVTLYITFESPLSGMSMNPARTFASALPAHLWTAAWIYFLVPPLAMLLAAELYRRCGELKACAKMHHEDGGRCLFCEYQARRTGQ
jgi:aquaporin Z